MKKKFPTFLDESALLHDRITVSAGVRGAQLFLAVKDLLPFVEAKCVPLTVK
jgi:Cys-tRNA(Pro)/Cys-tRNA(Cys) deacylase